MKNILITGAGGFIGSHIAEHYLKDDEIESIILVDNLSRMKLLNKENRNVRYNLNYLNYLNYLSAPFGFNKFKFYERDIRNFNSLKNLVKAKEIDVIFHTAAQTSVTTSITNPVDDFQNNVIGTFNLLESARLSNCDPIMILCSTNKVFGNNVNNCIVIEEQYRYNFDKDFSSGINEVFPIDLCEHTPYGASKLCSDLYFQEYRHTYGLRTGVFRMSCIYGTRQFGVEDQGWIAHFVISAVLGKKIKIFGDGKQVRDVLYITDLINAFDLYVKKVNQIKHNVFCIGGGSSNTLSLLELIDLLEKLLNKEIKFEFQEWRPSDQKVYISDIRKAKHLLKWSPKVNPEDGINKLVKWVKINKELFM